MIDPACTVAFEAEPPERDLMRQPPRPATSHLFDGWLIATGISQGASVLVAVALLYWWAQTTDMPEPQARAMAFASLVLANVGLILTNRSRHATLLTAIRLPNLALRWVVGATLFGLALVLGIEPLREAFRFGELTPYQLSLSVASALFVLAWLELYKWTRSEALRAHPG